MSENEYISGIKRIANPNQSHRYEYFLPFKIPATLEIKDPASEDFSKKLLIVWAN